MDRLKYAVSSGASILTYIKENDFELSGDYTKAIKYNTFGEAMEVCVKVNNLINKPSFKVLIIKPSV